MKAYITIYRLHTFGTLTIPIRQPQVSEGQQHHGGWLAVEASGPVCCLSLVWSSAEVLECILVTFTADLE